MLYEKRQKISGDLLVSALDHAESENNFTCLIRAHGLHEFQTEKASRASKNKAGIRLVLLNHGSDLIERRGLGLDSIVDQHRIPYIQGRKSLDGVAAYRSFLIGYYQGNIFFLQVFKTFDFIFTSFRDYDETRFLS